MSISVRIIFCLFALSICFLVAPRAVFACWCILPQPGKTLKQHVAEALGKSKAVFSGEVVSVVDEPRGFYVEIKFKVQTSWKQVSTNEITVRTGRGGGDCGYRFEVGESYLVYAYGSDESNLETNICQRTRKLADSREDLKLLGSGKIQGLAACSVTGAVLDRFSAIIPGVRITLTDHLETRSTESDSDGRYRLNLVPGKYTVSIFQGSNELRYKRAPLTISCPSRISLNIYSLPECVSYECAKPGYDFFSVPLSEKANHADSQIHIAASERKRSKNSTEYLNGVLTYDRYTILSKLIVQKKRFKDTPF